MSLICTLEDIQKFVHYLIREFEMKDLGKLSYLNAIGALMYLTQCTKLDIAFLVNMLARLSSKPN